MRLSVHRDEAGDWHVTLPLGEALALAQALVYLVKLAPSTAPWRTYPSMYVREVKRLHKEIVKQN